MVTVKISEKDGQQTTYQFDKPEITIGRMKGNDIVLPKGNVSKKHARLIDKGDTLQVDDLNSTNGTYVNGRKVTAQTKVTQDDKIYIGDFILQLQPESQKQAQSGPPSPPGADKPQPTGASGGPTNPPNKPNKSNAGKSRPNRSQPPSGASQPSASASKPGTSRPNQSQGGSTGANQSASASRPGARSQSGTPATGSSGGGKKKTDRGPSAKSSQGGSGSNSLDERFSSSGSDSPPSPSPDSPSPESHGGDSRGPASGTGVSGGNRASGSGSSKPGDRDRDERSVSGNDQRARSRERPAEDAGRRSPVSSSINLTPRPLTDNFDKDFHELHREAATALLNEVGGIDEFPIAYPPTSADRDAMRDHVSAALTAVNAGDEAGGLLESLLLEEAVALGPVEDLLDDPDVDAIRVNGFDRIVTRRNDDVVRERLCFGNPDFLRLAAERLLGERAPARATDRIRFSDGATARIVLPPVTLDEPILSIDSPVRATSLSNLVDDQCLTDRMADFLRAAVAGNQTVLTVSADDTSRQRALAALCNELPASSQAVGLSESELPGLDRPGCTQLDASPGEGWSRTDVLDAARQLNPDRIVVDEIRNAEAAGWVRAAISGAAGSIATIYGQTLEDGLDRLAAAGQSSAISGGPLDRHELAAAVDVVLLVGRTQGAQTRVVRIAELEDIDYDRFRLTDVFTYREEDGEAEFVDTGYAPSFLDALDPADLPSVDSTLFGDGD